MWRAPAVLVTFYLAFAGAFWKDLDSEDFCVAFIDLTLFTVALVILWIIGSAYKEFKRKSNSE